MQKNWKRRQHPLNAINTSGLRKSFGSQTVLDGVDLHVAPGEIFALLGSNGAGKTTMIHILATLLKADGGTAEICGFAVAQQAAKVREVISLTGQFAAVDEVLTGRENLVLVAKLRDVPNPAPAADALLARFGLTDAVNKRAGAYSGGMLRRLDIAMSMLGNPKVVFLDEPTTGLDPEARLEVWKTVKELARSGVTILLTTQYLEEAEQLADRIAILHSGKLIANGTLDELKKRFPPAKFVYVFGGAIKPSIGADVNYVSYLLPGILLMAIASGISYTAFRMFGDTQKGIFQRFSSMPIPRSAALWAHVFTSLVSNMLTVAVIFAVALLMGFWSSAGVLAWLAALGILMLFTLALTWVAVLPGITAKSVEGASAFSYPLMFLPFIRSAFVPTETMPAAVRWFAEKQPVTSIVDAVRSLLQSQPVGNAIWMALAWCVGIGGLFWVLSVRAYKRRMG